MYVEREKAKEELLAWAVCINHPEHLSKEDAMHILDQLPAANVVSLKEGQIIESVVDGKMQRVFSCCNTDCTQLTMWMTPSYCPHCGAKMK